MVKKPDERIKENTISNFSMEDQRIIETILVAILNEDSLSKSKLVELLQEPLQGSAFLFSQHLMYFVVFLFILCSFTYLLRITAIQVHCFLYIFTSFFSNSKFSLKAISGCK